MISLNQRYLSLFIHPLLIGAMVGCVLTPVVDILRTFLSTWNTTAIFILCALAALEGSYAHYLIRARELRGWDVLRFRVIEIGMIVIVIKLISLLMYPPTSLIALFVSWTNNPFAIFDPQTIIGLVIAFIAWHTATITAEDIADLSRFVFPNEMSGSYISPLQRLNERFFLSGGILLAATGVNYTPLAELISLSRPILSNVILNVLIYFVLGLVLLGQARYTALSADWKMREIKVSGDIENRWLRYSLILVLIAGAAVIFLPTRYTLSLLDLINTLVVVIFGIIFILSQIIAVLLAIPLTLLIMLIPKLPPLPFVLPLPAVRLPTPPAAPSGDWSEFLRSLIFWAMLIGVASYIVVNYLRERPELLEILRSSKVIRWMRGWWATLQKWWGVIRERVGARVAEMLRERWLGDAAKRLGDVFNFFSLRPRSPRDQIAYFYLSILQRASQKGFARSETETPYEYEPTLESNLPEAQGDAADLTQTFVEARYSAHAIGEDDLKRAKEIWERVREAMRATKPRRS
ncbi:MAG: DUF4129 domain-containing protein [Chloroflexota bacterium]